MPLARVLRLGSLASMLLVAACLADAPEFAPRERIPPFVLSGEVVPPLGVFYEGPIPFSMQVPFRSEDVNVPLQWRLYLDLVPGTATQAAIASDDVLPGIYDDPRAVSLDWTSPLAPGCHTVTMILTYVPNFDVITGLPRDESLAARVVWWLVVADSDGQVNVESCPAPSQDEPQL